MKKGLIAFLATWLVLMAVIGVIYAHHNEDDVESMTLYKSKFHYLGEILSRGVDANRSAEAGNYTIKIFNQDKTRHEVEFKNLDTGKEFKTPVISGGETSNLTVELTPGRWKVYCEMHGKGERGMLFYLTVE